MSLLMEALKKAEETKRLAGERNVRATPPAEPRELALTPLAEPSQAPESVSASPLPDLSMHFASVDADLASIPTEPPAKQPSSTPPIPADRGPAGDAERLAVRNVFAAKQPARAQQSGLWVFAGLCALAVFGIGGYFWWQLHSVSSGSLARPVQSQPATQAAVPAEAWQLPVVAEAEPVKPVPEALPPIAQSAPRPVPEPEPRPGARAPRLPTTAPQAVAPDGPVRLSRNPPKSNLALERAYDDFQSGKLDESQRGYERVLTGDDKNTDALLGLATIAARQGQTERSQEFYLRALESDPSNPTAQAGLINARGQADPGLAESRLKTALAGQPDSTSLLFALGNLYARQARWSEAQEAYFRAYSTEPDNADIIFNLAVSLDHLRQTKLAAQYYQRALSTADAAASRKVSFDRNQVKNRILELKP